MMRQFLIIITLALLKFRRVTCVPSASVTTIPASLNGSFCPTTVLMTCMTSDLTTLRWFIDDVELLTYAYSLSDESSLPIILPTPPIAPGLEITITSVAPSTVNPDFFDATSTLTTNTTVLQAFNMQDFTCGTLGTMSQLVTVDYDILGPPSTSSATCSLVTSVSGLNISLQWSSSFNFQYAVERYRVSVDPDPSSSCSSDQVMPSEDYSCPGLSTERNYSITVSAINCEDQEGENDTFTVLPQLLAPQSPGVPTVIPDSDIDGRLTVTWMESITTSGRCSFFGAINYTLILEDSAGEVVEESVVSSDSSCSNGSCSSSFSPSSQICRVSIMANNTFGESNPAIAIINPDRLTTDNQILLAVGVVLLCVALATAVILIVLRVHIKGSLRDPLSLVMLVVGGVVIVVPMVLWVAVGFQVGLQDNTCDSTWQLTRNNLIITAFVFSLLCIMVILIFSVFAAVIVLCGKKSTVTQCLQKSMASKRSSKAMGTELISVKIPDVQAESQYATTLHSNTAKQLVPTEKPSEYSHLETEVVKKEEKHYLPLDHGKGKQKSTARPTFQAQPTYGQLGTHSEMELLNEHKRKATSDKPGDKPIDAIARLQEAAMEVPRCITLYKNITKDSRPKHVAEWFPYDRKWSIDNLSKDKKLGVFFMNECPWKYDKKKISRDVIIKFLQESWKDCFEIVKKMKKNPHIRVKFQDKSSGNWSAIGCEAMNFDPVEPTMVLDFSGMNNIEIMATVVHQFGHALGLGHAVMKPEHWKTLKPYVDMRSMISDCGALTVKDLEDQWTGKNLKRSIVNYDEDSIMKQSFSPSWLKQEFSKLPNSIKKLVPLQNKKDLSPMDTNILTVIKLAPPRYDLEPDFVIALKGESAMMKCNVISDHKMPTNIKHTIRRADGTAVRNDFFEISEDWIIFPEVESGDNGIYTISCYNDDGSEGKESFELVFVPGRPKYVFKCDSVVGDNIVEAVVGENIVIPFTVTLCKNTTLDEAAGHRIIKVDGTNRSRIKENCITFSQVKQSDKGTYKITCYDNNAVEGEGIIQLNVTQGTRPVYELNCKRVVTMAGDSPTINFTVESHPPFLKEPLHRVFKKSNPGIFFTLDDGHNNTITFHDVKVSDTGFWVIQCTNPCGLSGEKSIELEIYSPGTNVDTTPLSENVFADVMEDLSDVIPQWYKIGKILGLQSSVLEEIKKKSFDPPSAMIMFIKHWLGNDMHGHRELITWKSLVKAVAHKNGGNNVALAMKLAKKHEDIDHHREIVQQQQKRFFL